VMASMAHLQEEKLRLQEELLGLQEKLTARENDEVSHSLQLQGQVETLTAKLLEQAQEIGRLRSELGGTDAEKHRDLLAAENERLRQEMKACEGELRELRRQQQAPCRDCAHLQENAGLQERLSQLQQEAEEMRVKLAELDLEVQQKTNRLAEVELRLKDSLAERAEEEERLSRRLRDSQETIASLKSQPQQIKYLIKTVEVESAKAKQALCESQSRNQYLQEQVGMQRQVLKEMEQQLQSSQKTAAQLRAQIMMYEAELERAHGQMLEEMQAMEEEKNRAIEEAFSRAQVEMKAVHENLAGVRTNLLTLQPALRTLTHDYNSLKRQRGARAAPRGLAGCRLSAVTAVPCLSPSAFSMSPRLRPDSGHDPDGPDTLWGASLGLRPQGSPGHGGGGGGLWQVWGRLASPPTSPQVFEFGHVNRATECTNLNEHSSRSHALLIVTVRGFDRSTGLRTTGKLNLVDLAGSERVGRSGAEGSRLREAQHINKSLSALGDVIYALRSRQGHVPFRNSKLTYLLQDSLSGDSKTLMMVQVSPAEKNTSETLCSLKFAERVRSVELGPISRKAELASWPSQEQLEVTEGPLGDSLGTAAPSGRGHASSSPGQLSGRATSIRRKLQTSG
ncbi:Kinesin-like protein KIFC3, partial [Spheniscus mendiculus]